MSRRLYPSQPGVLPGGAPNVDNNLSEYAGAKAAAARVNLGVPGNDDVLPRRITSGYVCANKTLVETPAAVFAGGSALASRRWLIIRNESPDTRARIGRLQANLQRDGEVIEPGAVVFIQLEPAIATIIYGCSEGAPISCNVGEDVG